MTNSLAVIICSLNGAEGVVRCIDALHSQKGAPPFEIVVVDDGSSDGTAAAAEARGALVVQHPTNRGLAAARNSGIAATRATIAAFLDDDCEPEPTWAQRLLSAYDEHALGVGGLVIPTGPDTYITRFLTRHNPLQPLEADLSTSSAWLYRLGLYLREQWFGGRGRTGRRYGHSLVGANMSFRREAVLAAGGFDERFTFGAEELDLCLRLRRLYPESPLVIEPSARVRHHFEQTLRDTLRRSRAYGRGSARMDRKWKNSRPTLFPFPFLVTALVAAGLVRTSMLPLGLASPVVLYSGWIRALKRDGLETLGDPYVQLLQEAWNNVGLIQGLWEFRDFHCDEIDLPPAVADSVGARL